MAASAFQPVQQSPFQSLKEFGLHGEPKSSENVPSVPGFSAIPNRQTCCDYPLEAARRRPTLNTRAVRTYQTAALVSTATEYRQPVLRDYASDQNTGKKHYQSWKKQNSGEGMNI